MDKESSKDLATDSSISSPPERSNGDHLEDVSAGAPVDNPLSEREMDVAQLLVTGASNNEIARNLVISPHTVKVHLRNIYEKLQVGSRTEASLLLLKQGWVLVPGVQTTSPDVEESQPPEPEPLLDQPVQLGPWQRGYLVAAMAVFLALLVAPAFANRAQSWPRILSDADVIPLGPLAVVDLPRWESRTPLPQPRSRFAMVNQGGQIYAIGGETSQGRTMDAVDLYDLSINEWRPAAPLPQPLANLAAAALARHIYVAGGSWRDNNGAGQETISDALLAYDPMEDTWQEVGRLPVPLAGAALVSSQDALYLLGGWDGQAMHDEVWRFSPGMDAKPARPGWELVARLETARAFLGAVAVDGQVYVVGGYDGQRELDTAAIYSLTTGTWERLPNLSTPRGGLTLVYDGFALFALGGGWTQPVETHERYDPGTGMWSNFQSPVVGEWRNLGAASENGRLHLIGGWSGGYLNIHLRYQSLFNMFLPFTQQ